MDKIPEIVSAVDTILAFAALVAILLVLAAVWLLPPGRHRVHAFWAIATVFVFVIAAAIVIELPPSPSPPTPKPLPSIGTAGAVTSSAGTGVQSEDADVDSGEKVKGECNEKDDPWGDC